MTRNSYLSCLWADWRGAIHYEVLTHECMNGNISDFAGKTKLFCYPVENYHPVLSVAKVSAVIYSS